jgi:hypothetical protein
MDAALRVIEQSEDARTKIIAAVQESITTHMDQQDEIFERVMQENIRANKENADRFERLLSSMKAKSHGGGTEPPP